jgi:hypothetical protein
MSLDVQTSLDFGNSRRILNLPSPASDNEPARLVDLNAALEGLAWKDNVVVAASTNVTIASPGATVDGISMVANDRVLLIAQTVAASNGIYVWNGSAVPMTRALDANTSVELENATVSVDEGTSAGSTYRQSSVNFVLDAGDIIWGGFGAATPQATEATAGKAEIATQAEVDALTDDQRFITPLKLANWSGRSEKFAQTIGDGSSTAITVTHNFNSRDVEVEVYRNSGNYDTVLVETRRTSVNAVQLVFDVAPASNAYAVVVRV